MYKEEVVSIKDVRSDIDKSEEDSVEPQSNFVHFQN